MTVGELRRVIEPLSGDAEVLATLFKEDQAGAYRRVGKATIEAVVISPNDVILPVVCVKASQYPSVQAALVIR
jgi:hypothetical protein